MTASPYAIKTPLLELSFRISLQTLKGRAEPHFTILKKYLKSGPILLFTTDLRLTSIKSKPSKYIPATKSIINANLSSWLLETKLLKPLI